MRYYLILVFCFLSLFAPAQTGRTYASVAQRRAFYDQLAAKYNSPAIREILASDKKNTFDQYVDGHSEEQLIKDYGTVIHELLHGYDDSEFEAHHYFIAPGSKVKVPVGKYYNSKELNTLVRKGAQDSIFRYGLYIGGRSDLQGLQVDLNKSPDSEAMSVKMGIYGIVEEYNASAWRKRRQLHSTNFGCLLGGTWCMLKRNILKFIRIPSPTKHCGRCLRSLMRSISR